MGDRSTCMVDECGRSADPLELVLKGEINIDGDRAVTIECADFLICPEHLVELAEAGSLGVSGIWIRPKQGHRASS